MNYYNNDNDYYHYDDNTTITQWENKQTINETLQLQNGNDTMKDDY